MAGETYYFAFSLLAAIGLVLHVVNLIYFGTNGKTVMGEEFKPGTPGYRRFKVLTSGRGLFVTTGIGLLILANMAYDIHRVHGLNDHKYARFILVYFTAGIVIFSIVMFILLRSRSKSTLEGKR